MLEVRQEGKYILIGVDYFTRYAFAEVINNKTAKEILDKIKKWTVDIKPEEIITDHGKEFCNEDFRRYCIENEITHRVVSIESHGSNGRVERLLRTIREGLAKIEDGNVENNIGKLISSYNNTYHSGIKCTPSEAKDSDNETGLIEQNSKFSSYSTCFRKGFREKFKAGDIVRIAKHENIKGNQKSIKGRYLEQGEVIEVFGGDSYLIRKEDGKIIKRRHYDLKKDVQEADETNRLKEGML